MPDRWLTFPVEFSGGLVTNLSPLQQGINFPGTAQVMRNFEPSTDGGYRRIEGYSKWDDAAVTGSGLIRGVHEFGQNAFAARGTHLYRSAGSGWTQLTDNATYSSGGITLSGSGRVRFAEHHFGSTSTLIITDGTAKPYKWDGSTFAQITTAPSEVLGADFVVTHKDHLFFANDTTVTFTAPFSDTDFTAASGAGTIEFDKAITDMISFRQQLVIFTEQSIHVLAGSTIADFQLQPVTNDIGAVAPGTAQEIGGDVIFLGPDGLRLLSATERNNDFGLAVVSKQIQPTMTQFIGQSSTYSSLIIRSKSQYRIFGYNASFTDAASRGIIGTQFAGQGGEGMQWSETRGINAYVASSSLRDTEEYILFANDDGYVYRMESGNSFDGTNIIASFKTPDLPIQDPSTRKSMYKMKLFVDPQGGFSSELSTEYDYNQANVVQPDVVTISNTASPASFYGTATYGTSGFGGNLQYIFDIQLTGSGNVVAFNFESDSSDPPFSLDSMIIQYGQYGRR